jgi:hypothetical protein
MWLRVFVIALVVLLALLALWSAGLAIAALERDAFVRRHVLGAATARTIDLRPSVYADLPDPVRRYFDHAFNGRTEVVARMVEWWEEGTFLLPIGRFHVHGRQASRPADPVYAWTGVFARFGLPLLESRDSFFLHGHDMRARLFGWFRVMHTDYDDPADRRSLHAYLVLRYFGQAPLMPWALLPNEHVAWRANDDRSAWLDITRVGLEGRYLVTFDASGGIARMETDRLLMEGNGTMQTEVGVKSDYRVVDGFRVPTRLDYRWYLADGALVGHYAFEVTRLMIHR